MALASLEFALTGLSAASLSQKELSALIVQHGGRVSNLVHRRVDYLLASPLAVQRNTQAVRKAAKHSLPVLRPSYALDSIAAARPLDPADYLAHPAPAPAAPAAPAPPCRGARLRDAIRRLEVCVEMAAPPSPVWWAATRGARLAGSPRRYALTYARLPSRGYEQPTPSQCVFKPGGGRWLWDAEEEVWRRWRTRRQRGAARPPRRVATRGRWSARDAFCRRARRLRVLHRRN
ncbi:hypothetical protein AB1Y20_016348 [Prymnesium parvum]|uniref:BRCT domain-containing protein n=1 Tax=Prymnesium parvum TaxID=97485 RepID=A0AB34IEI6_PRYPA